MSQKEVDGYWYEAGDDIDTESASFIMRRSLFLDGDGEYKRNARVCGFLYHDLVRLRNAFCLTLLML